MSLYNQLIKFKNYFLNKSSMKNISLKEHKVFLEQTFQLAKLSRTNGNHPFGAILVYENNVILTAENHVITTRDVTAHAEMELIRKASKYFDKNILAKAILYTSTEPCTMCAGAIYWSGISHVIFGCSAKRLEAIANGGLAIPSSNIFKQGKRNILSHGPYFEREAAQIHKDFWNH